MRCTPSIRELSLGVWCHHISDRPRPAAILCTSTTLAPQTGAWALGLRSLPGRDFRFGRAAAVSATLREPFLSYDGARAPERMAERPRRRLQAG
jgi:hypothetical protein